MYGHLQGPHWVPASQSRCRALGEAKKPRSPQPPATSPRAPTNLLQEGQPLPRAPGASLCRCPFQEKMNRK